MESVNLKNDSGKAISNSVSESFNSDQDIKTKSRRNHSTNCYQNTDEVTVIHSSKDCSSSKICSNDELAFNDWDFIDKYAGINESSDDESIIIIEREICRPADIISLSGNETENEDENCKDISSDVTVSDKNIETNEDQSDIYSLIEVQNNQITNTSEELRISLWWINFTILCIVFASLIVLQCPKVSVDINWKVHDNENIKKETNVPFAGSVAQDDSLSFMNYLQEDIKLKKSVIDEMFIHQIEMLKHVRYVKNKKYVLNVSEFAQKRFKLSSLPNPKISIFNLLNWSKDLLPCKYDIENYRLPVMCEGNQDILLLLNENQLISVYDGIGNFYQDYNKKYGELDDYILRTLTRKSITEDAKTIKDVNSFIQDCDNFSKNYKTNFCSKTNVPHYFDSSVADVKNKNAENMNVRSNKENEKSLNLDQKIELENGHTNSQRSNLVDNETIQKDTENVKIEDENKKSRSTKIGKELKQFIRKFKQDFENLYYMYMEAEDLENYEQNSGVQNDFKIYVDYSSQNETASGNSSKIETPNMKVSDSENDNSKTLSGEWLFNLNAARSKLREYYEHAVTGDWILKLGKAREKLRKKHKENKDEESYKKEYKNDTKNRKQWYKKAPEKLKNAYKKFTSKWKSQFKKVKEGILHNYDKYVPSEWQFNLKNMWQYL